jgi:flagellin-specific chaperone FliS
MTPSSRQKEYLAIRITTASPMELVRILYEGAVQAVHDAIRALAELRVSLRHDVQDEYSNTLAELYGYIQHQLIRAHAEQSENLLQEASRLLNTLLEGWSGAMDKLAARDQTGQREAVGQAADPVAAANPYSSESPGLRLESRTWQL